MSWSINAVGKPRDVAALASKNENVPRELVAVITAFAIAGEVSDTTSNYGAMRLVTSGHYGPSDAWSGVTLTIERLQMAPPSP